MDQFAIKLQNSEIIHKMEQLVPTQSKYNFVMEMPNWNMSNSFRYGKNACSNLVTLDEAVLVC